MVDAQDLKTQSGYFHRGLTIADSTIQGDRQGTKRYWYSAPIGTIVGTILALLILELLLRALDPLGFVYFDDLRTYGLQLKYNPALEYSQNDGTIQGHGWKAHIQKGFRVVPDNHGSDLTIAIIGDSVTFGLGVNDSETFINILARKFTSIHFINGGVAGYNSKQILDLHNQIKANRFLYLVNPNDDSGGIPFDYWQKKMGRISPFWIVRHYKYFRYQRMGIWNIGNNYKPHNTAEDFSEMKKDRRVTMAAFGNSKTIRLAVECFKAYNIQDYMRVPGLRISYIDSHPNAKGHEFIAEQLEAIVRRMIRN